MPLLQDIQNYSIHSSTLLQDKQFLIKIGDRLCVASREEIKPELIYAIAEFLTDFFKKLRKQGKLDNNIQKTLIKLRGKAYGLEQKIDDKKLNTKYYTNALELGSKIYEFAQALKFIVIGTLIESLPPHLLG